MLSAVQIFISKSSLWWLNCHILTSRELLTYWKYLVGDSLFDRIAVVNSILRDLVLEIPTSCNSNPKQGILTFFNQVKTLIKITFRQSQLPSVSLFWPEKDLHILYNHWKSSNNRLESKQSSFWISIEGSPRPTLHVDSCGSPRQ